MPNMAMPPQQPVSMAQQPFAAHTGFQQSAAYDSGGKSDMDIEIEKYQHAIEAPQAMMPPQSIYQAQPAPPPASFQVEHSYTPGTGGYDDMAATPGNSAIFEFEEELFASLSKGKK